MKRGEEGRKEGRKSGEEDILFEAPFYIPGIAVNGLNVLCNFIKFLQERRREGRRKEKESKKERRRKRGERQSLMTGK